MRRSALPLLGRGVSIVERAGVGGPANVTVEVAMRHIDDAEALGSARLAARSAQPTHVKSFIDLPSDRRNWIGCEAKPRERQLNGTLSERELEVLDLARGPDDDLARD